MSEKHVALVTGASRGIGAAIADLLCEAGHTVIGTATTENGAERIEARLKAMGNGAGASLDVCSSASIDATLNGIKSRFGPPTVLVNNAGITRDQLLLRMSEDDWDAILDTNLKSVFRLSKACLRGMMKARWGRIVSIASVVGSTGNPGQANYSAAKAGMVGFSKSLAQEVGSRGITVNVVAPGFIATDMTDELAENQRQALLDKVPLARLGDPRDIAMAVAFLVGESGNYITGETLHVNGGMYMS